jgi:hypothetical protein
MRPSSLCWNIARDAPFLALAAIHGVVLAAWPTLPVIALGVWWNSNTIAHNFIHRPFFRQRSCNLLFAAYLSVLLGIPQALWRDRHLAHHAGVPWRWRTSRQLLIETALIVSLWTALATLYPHFFAAVYLPGYVAGLALCSIQGHYEHAQGVTSHYGRVYNFLCFNDGYHAEHHAHPGVAWTGLPERIQSGARTSVWPALLRGLDQVNLEGMEWLVLRSPRLQRMVLQCHRRAFRALLPKLAPIRRVTIVGGGLFPRTALLIQELIPDVHITIIDASARNLATARPFVGGAVEFVHSRYTRGDRPDCDLIVIPLCFDGDRDEIYRNAPRGAPVLVHDWIWRRRGTGRIVSLALLKRLNLVTG